MEAPKAVTVASAEGREPRKAEAVLPLFSTLLLSGRGRRPAQIGRWASALGLLRAFGVCPAQG